ncbi:MAG: ribokinase, partial [Gammaproteobacteria bacterium]|nr:ribokinase [Gammaproteobacteria bacterium]
KHGVPVILNPAPAQNLPRELLSLVDFLIPNESETALLTNLPTTSYAEIDVAARKLLQLGVEAVIMTLGERGS